MKSVFSKQIILYSKGLRIKHKTYRLIFNKINTSLNAFTDMDLDETNSKFGESIPIPKDSQIRKAFQNGRF